MKVSVVEAIVVESIVANAGQLLIMIKQRILLL